ncbi:GNAT family N-acetyltransferase [Paenibacillus harenae]|uniref:GNAT family N-acetyltransferase n=1 Tax=Paenibacillus harenae TaxID=306543 RepID=UPI000419FAE8|nr:GNAT family N-acetyltransferase [Paenibacillus harenae]
MSDMLVKLYELPKLEPDIQSLADKGIDIRRAIAPEKHIVIEWVRNHFNEGWASECEAAFANQPVSCFLAVKDGELIGFACYEATCKNFFGPTGISENERKAGAGKGLLLASLHAMRGLGYGYAVIGSAGPKEYYAKMVGAEIIENSTPGIYKGLLTK